MRAIRLPLWGATLVFGALAVLHGCSNEDPVVPAPNAAPETELTAESPRLEGGVRRILLQWSGSDPEGAVSHYETRLLQAGDDAAVAPWARTSDVLLDLELPDAPLGGDPTMTFEVRAVDNAGMVDPTPARAAFSPLSLAPEVTIDVPVYIPSNTCLQWTRAPYFAWSAFDADSKGQHPVETRYILWEVPFACLTRVEFERNAPLLSVPEAAWSPWAPYAPADPDDPGRRVQFPLLDTGRIYLFAVQARDEDGATTRVFEWGKNVRHIQISDNVGPVLVVVEGALGVDRFSSTTGALAFDVLSTQQLQLEWEADASQYGGYISGYRFGVDVVDPDDPNDPGWAVDWGVGPAWQTSGPMQFASGVHVVVIQARDHTGSIVRARYDLTVRQVPPRDQQRDLLLVDDSPHGGTSSELAAEQANDLAWSSLLTSLLPGYDPAMDVIDAQDDAASLTLGRLLQYRSVIWATRFHPQTFLHTNLAPVRVGDDSVLRFNWLDVYQHFAGNLLLVGPGAAYGLLEYDPPTWRFPIVFDTPEDFGVVEVPGGGTINGGTLRAPYRAFCLEAIDLVRPPPGSVYGETAGAAGQLRSIYCDAMYSATLAPAFAGRYPGFPSLSLRPGPERATSVALNYLHFEELYNVNASLRDVQLDPRDCQVPMFLLHARRAEMPVDPAYCAQPGPTSPLEGAPVAIMSTAYAQTKPLSGSADFLWGFDPTTFLSEDVGPALRWVFAENWQLATHP